MIKAVVKLVVYILLLIFGLSLCIYFIVEIKDNFVILNGHMYYVNERSSKMLMQTHGELLILICFVISAIVMKMKKGGK